jgi:cyclophilin family peptidyl-prolyl cis-trans isomerase
MRQREGRQARMEELRLAQQAKQKRRQYFLIGGAVIVLFVAFLILTGRLFGSGSKKKAVAATSTTTVAPTTTTAVPTPTTAAVSHAVPVIPAPANVGCPKADGSSPHYTKFTAAPPMCIDPTKTYTATLTTDVGAIAVTLDPKAAPKTVNNFVFLAGYHFYDGTVFHRAVPGFMDQGGDPTGTGSGGPGYSFADELPKLSDYKAGSVAMANSGPDTNGSQFFILLSQQGGQALGQASYSLFGQVTAGLDVAQKINNDGDADPNPPKVVHTLVKVTVAVS